jgi:hypothetical protein
MKKVKGHIWMIREFGLRCWWNYERARRSGVTIDYSLLLTYESRDDDA